MLHTTRVREPGRSPSTVLYRERLVPGLWWWLVVAALVAMIAIAYGAALGGTTGMVVAVGLGVIAIVVLVRSSPLVEVTHEGLRCAKASLPRESWHSPRLVGTQEMSTVRRGLDDSVGDRAYHVVPVWLGRRGVLVPINDDVDPHTAWLLASRHPDALLEALSTRVPE